ncbi:MAG: hypothetical protein H7X99_02510 [Saprospiraceae bacterium]|nr:hypothetical protein [Saprospiraceae bacterium]
MTNRSENIQKELQELAPTLANLPKTNPLTVPDSYFEIVEDRILSQLYLISTTETCVNDVPTDYFDQVESLILENIQKEAKPTKIIVLPFIKPNFFRYAAILIFFTLCIAVFSFYQKTNAEDAEIALQEEYIDYMTEDIEEFDINLLIENDLIDESALDDVSYLSIYNETSDLFDSEINF